MTGKYDHIIDVRFEVHGASKTQGEIQKAMGAIDKGGKVSAQTTSQINTLTGSMQKMGLTKEQVRGVFQQFDPSQTNIKLTDTQLKQFNKSLVTSGASKSQIAGINKELKQTGAVAANTTGAMGQLGMAMKRALVVAPVWLIMRSAMMLVIRTTGDMIKAYMDLESGMARIRTVMHGVASDVGAEMIAIKRQILDSAVDSRISIKDLSEAFYFLKTSSLDADQAIAAFIPTINAMTGTGVGAKEMARAIAGTFNTMGKYMTEVATDAEKFQKIADILTYTFTKQDVEMNELIAGYTKLAPYLSGVDNSFLEIITTLGFLNTRMLRSGRTGQLLGRTFLQLTKNAKQLASLFEITFDPSKPLNFLKVFEQIGAKLGDTTKLTAMEMEGLREIFQIRGLVPVGLLIKEMDELAEVIKLAGEESEGFAAKIAKIKMGTIEAQSARLKNILATLFEEFVTGVYGTGNLAGGLTLINDSFKSMIEPIKSAGNRIGWFALQMAKVILMIEEINKLSNKQYDFFNFKFVVPMGAGVLLNAKELYQTFKDMGLLEFASFEDYLKTQTKLREEAEKEKTVREQLLKSEEESAKFAANSLTIEEESISHQINLLKIRKASALDIARYNLQALESVKSRLTDEEYELEVLKRQNTVIEEQEKYREELSSKLISHELELLKIRGANETELLRVKYILEDQFNINQGIFEQLQGQIDLEKELTQEKMNQLKLSGDATTLLKIANDYGIKEAHLVNEVLAGRKKLEDVGQWTRGIIKSRFPSRFPEIEAQEELIGRLERFVGIETVTPGAKIPTPTVAIPSQLMIPEIKIPAVTTQIEAINISIQQKMSEGLHTEEMAEQMIVDIAKEIRTNPQVKNAIAEQIENF